MYYQLFSTYLFAKGRKLRCDLQSINKNIQKPFHPLCSVFSPSTSKRGGKFVGKTANSILSIDFQNTVLKRILSSIKVALKRYIINPQIEGFEIFPSNGYRNLPVRK